MYVSTHYQLLVAFALVGFALSSGTTFASGLHKGGHLDTQGKGKGHTESFEFGGPGKVAEVTRTIEIIMGDNYFEPQELTIQAGETVRFVIKNDGQFLHEFNIGTASMHIAHQEEMTTMMEHGMLTPTGIDHDRMNMDHTATGVSGHAHDDPNSVLVEPGKSLELIWKFAAASNLEFACNIPGHYESGMVGEFEFDPATEGTPDS